MGLAVPAPRPPPPPAAAEAARVAAATAAAAASSPPVPQFTPLPPPLPSYRSLQSYTEGATPSAPLPPPPPPLRPPPTFSQHHHAHSPLSLQQPPPLPPHSGNMTPLMHAPLSGGGFDLPSGGFHTAQKGKRFRGEYMSTITPTAEVGSIVMAAPAVAVTPRAKGSQIEDVKPWCRRRKGGRRPLTPVKARVRDELPGSPDSATSKELRDMLTPYAPSMSLNGAVGEVDAKQPAVQPALEAIGESFGLSNEDVFISSCPIEDVIDQLTNNDYVIGHLDQCPTERGNVDQCGAESTESITLFQ